MSIKEEAVKDQSDNTSTISEQVRRVFNGLPPPKVTAFLVDKNAFNSKKIDLSWQRDENIIDFDQVRILRYYRTDPTIDASVSCPVSQEAGNGFDLVTLANPSMDSQHQDSITATGSYYYCIYVKDTAGLWSPPELEKISVPNFDSIKASFSLASSTFDETAGEVKVAVELTEPHASEVKLPFEISASSTAAFGDDYTSTATEITFPAGTTKAEIALQLVYDSVDEPAETPETVVLSFKDTGWPGTIKKGLNVNHTLYIRDVPYRLRLSSLPSSVDPAEKLNVAVGPSSPFTHYRYKLGPSSAINCADSDSYQYSSNRSIANPITDDLTNYLLGTELTLCVFGIAGTVPPNPDYNQSSVFKWVRDQASPINFDHLGSTFWDTQDKEEKFSLLLDKDGAYQTDTNLLVSVFGTVTGSDSSRVPSSTPFNSILGAGMKNVDASFTIKQNTQTTNERLLGFRLSATEKPGVVIGPYGYQLNTIRDSQVATNQGIMAGSAGTYHSCFIRKDGQLFCWGRNDYGQVGDGTTTSRSKPTPISGGPYKAVAVGEFHTCAITSSNKLKCWGWNNIRQLGLNGNWLQRAPSKETTPTDVDTSFSYKLITAGMGHTCGLTTNSKIRCWGWNSLGQVGSGSTEDSQPPVTIDSATSYKMIAAGFAHTCAIDFGDKVKCWGLNDVGQLGEGTKTTLRIPTSIKDDNKYQDIATGGYETAQPGYSTFSSKGGSHTCGITIDEELRCWGHNEFGQLGRKPNEVGDQSIPMAVFSDLKFKTVGVGAFHTCAIAATETSSAGALHCWGRNNFGQLASGDFLAKAVPQQVASTNKYAQLFSRSLHTCAIDEQEGLKCWGGNYYEQLGLGTASLTSRPPTTVTALAVSDISAGRFHNCALIGTEANKTLHCWGRNTWGELGDGSAVVRNFPIPVDRSQYYTMISAGPQHSCGVTSEGRLRCWGENSQGQLGDGTTVGTFYPKAIDFGVSYLKVAVGKTHSCAITKTNSLYCWGNNTYGQLGTGNTDRHLKPVAIDAQTSYRDISLGDAHTCGITITNLLKCWGRNSQGQVGNGDSQFVDVLSPSSVDAGFYYQKISSGAEHTCGIASTSNTFSDRSVRCWGSHSYGQLGRGSNVTTKTSSPGQISDVSSYHTVVAGARHTCGITTGNTLKCWGDNGYLQLGNGNATGQTIPQEIQNGSSSPYFRQVALGERHTCGLLSNNNLKCWGEDTYGQLGHGGLPTWLPLPILGFY